MTSQQSFSETLLVIGMQSASPRMLHPMGRNHTVQEGEDALKIANRAGLRVLVDLIFCVPEENEDDRYLTLDVNIQ